MTDWKDECAGLLSAVLRRNDSVDSYRAYVKHVDKIKSLLKEPKKILPAKENLIEKVGSRIEYGIDANQDPEGIARSAVREVSAWLKDTSSNWLLYEREYISDVCAILLEQTHND